MLAKAEPFAARAQRAKLRPSSHGRILSIRANEPRIRNSHVSGVHMARIDICNAHAPMENDACLGRALDQKLMQPDAP